MNPKILVLVALAGILYSLGSSLYHLTASRGDPKKLLRALTWRIALSVGCFLLLFVAWYFGLIQPHGIGG
jgi:O-antigen/teichoic acid export membrane protein